MLMRQASPLLFLCNDFAMDNLETTWKQRVVFTKRKQAQANDEQMQTQAVSEALRLKALKTNSLRPSFNPLATAPPPSYLVNQALSGTGPPPFASSCTPSASPNKSTFSTDSAAFSTSSTSPHLPFPTPSCSSFTAWGTSGAGDPGFLGTDLGEGVPGRALTRIGYWYVDTGSGFEASSVDVTSAG